MTAMICSCGTTFDNEPLGLQHIYLYVMYDCDDLFVWHDFRQGVFRSSIYIPLNHIHSRARAQLSFVLLVQKFLYSRTLTEISVKKDSS